MDGAEGAPAAIEAVLQDGLRYHLPPVSAVPEMPAPLERALRQLQAGGMVIVCDDPDREDEGDLCMAAEFVTAKAITFMACEARGLICLSLPEERCDELELPLMVPAGTAATRPASASRSRRRPASPRGSRPPTAPAPSRSRSIRPPGPRISSGPATSSRLRARPRGVLERRGQTEAAVDLTRLAGLTPGGVLCEVMNDDGTMARGPQLLGVLPPPHAAGGHGRRDRDLPAQQRARRSPPSSAHHASSVGKPRSAPSRQRSSSTAAPMSPVQSE